MKEATFDGNTRKDLSDSNHCLLLEICLDDVSRERKAEVIYLFKEVAGIINQSYLFSG